MILLMGEKFMFEIIKSRFEKAVNDYDNNAIAQLEIVNKLYSIIPEKNLLERKRREWGGGKGKVSHLLKERKEEKW